MEKGDKTIFRLSRTLDRYARVLFFSKISAFWFFKRIVAIHIPDSISKFGNHGEVFPLYEKFRQFNKGNNGGDVARLISWVLNIKNVVEQEQIEGDFAEIGVYRGNSAAVLAHYAKRYNRHCYLFDTFSGFDDRDLIGIDRGASKTRFSKTSVKLVEQVIGRDLIGRYTLVTGYFPDSLPPRLGEKYFSVVSLDCDLYQPTRDALEWFFERMHDGAIFLLHDYSSGIWEGSCQAINEFCVKHGQYAVLLPDKSGSAVIRVRKR